MTETEQLKRQADEARARERMSELEQYIQLLFTGLEEAHDAKRRHANLVMATTVTWWISVAALGILGGPIMNVVESLAFCLFILVSMREWIFILPHYFGILDELRGCITTLEILGIIEKGQGHRKRMKKYQESAIAKVWEALKAKRMREVFA